jgi:dTDP-4-dehydrorhamnose reductase
MKVLLLGANGQLGYELSRTCPSWITFQACDFPEVDFGSTRSLSDCIESTLPDCIINAAAYTAVDQAEQEQEQAFRVNHEAVTTLAQQAQKKKLYLVHVSTDFVFNGRNYRPYSPNDIPNPESVYGHSKLKGELAVKDILGDKALIIRTAWLYSAHGKNFVKTMLKLMTEKEKLAVIDEQIGTPTWAYGLAGAIWASIDKKLSGTYHWTDAGVASWYDFAVAIQEEGFTTGLLLKSIPILPVPTSQYPTPAKRPFYSVLDKTDLWQAADITPVHWRVQLRSMLKELL